LKAISDSIIALSPSIQRDHSDRAAGAARRVLHWRRRGGRLGLPELGLPLLLRRRSARRLESSQVARGCRRSALALSGARFAEALVAGVEARSPSIDESLA